MKYSLDKYKYFNRSNREVIAVSTYAGKTVRGVAKLTPGDAFDEAKGRELAAARCNEKIARKRLARATKKMAEAKASYEKEKAWYDRMVGYYNDSMQAANAARENVRELETTM